MNKMDNWGFSTDPCGTTQVTHKRFENNLSVEKVLTFKMVIFN